MPDLRDVDEVGDVRGVNRRRVCPRIRLRLQLCGGDAVLIRGLVGLVSSLKPKSSSERLVNITRLPVTGFPFLSASRNVRVMGFVSRIPEQLRSEARVEFAPCTTVGAIGLGASV